MPSLFRFDASAAVHTCSSSHRTPAPLTARRQPQRSPPRLLTDAACGGLQSPPPRQPRRTYPHHWHSTDRANDLLHRHHFPSGHTWVPIIRPWALTRGFALHPGTRNRYEIRDTRTQHRPPSRQVNDHGRVSGTHRVDLWGSTPMIMTQSLIRQRLSTTAGTPTSRPTKGITPLLSQTAAGRQPGRTPWQSQPKRQAVHEPTRPTTYRTLRPLKATPTGPHIQVGGLSSSCDYYSMRYK